MPEIVEVCWLSNYLNAYKGYKVIQLNVLAAKYQSNSFEHLVGLTIDSVNTHGKVLWISYKDSDLHLFCHFGLHGLFTHKKSTNSKVEILLTNKDSVVTLYFDAKLGAQINAITTTMLQTKLDTLGSDFFKTKIDANILMNRLKTITKNGTKMQNKKIVSLLLDQSKNGIGSGIGNYLVSEILYHAMLSPHTTTTELLMNQNYVFSLANAIIVVLKWVYMTSTEKYFKKLDEQILDYIKDTRNTMPIEYLYYPEVDISTLGKFSCQVYNKEKDPKGNNVIEENIVSGRKCFWVTH
jgi:formamidopyrimidine-DNA glycosylase